MVETFSFNYSFWLNLIALGAIAWFVYLNGKHSTNMMSHQNHGEPGELDKHDHGVTAGQALLALEKGRGG